MPTKYKTILLFGPPGCGKGTQGKVLGQLPGYYHYSSGDLFRSLDMESALGKVFTVFSGRGDLVPDDLTVKLWEETMQKLVDAKKFDPDTSTLILDGIPRNVNQAKMLADKIEVTKLFNLVCANKDLLVQRLRKRALMESRKDDDEATIRRRLEVYDEETLPMLEYYARVRINIDGTPSPLEVLKLIVERL